MRAALSLLLLLLPLRPLGFAGFFPWLLKLRVFDRRQVVGWFHDLLPQGLPDALHTFKLKLRRSVAKMENGVAFDVCEYLTTADSACLMPTARLRSDGRLC
jgi:hypothetical protein